jgi:hypothetical protein
MALTVVIFGLSFLAWTKAQFPPQPSGVTTLPSRFHPGITVSYKETDICETSPGVKSFAGRSQTPFECRSSLD